MALHNHYGHIGFGLKPKRCRQFPHPPAQEEMAFHSLVDSLCKRFLLLALSHRLFLLRRKQFPQSLRLFYLRMFRHFQNLAHGDSLSLIT